MKHMRGLSLQLLRLLSLAGICAVCLLALLRFGSDRLIGEYFPGSALQRKMVEKRIESFGDYISGNSLSATDTSELLRWCDKQPMVLMEIYRHNILFFNSNYDSADSLSEQNIEPPRYAWYSYYEVPFADGPAEVLVYSDESYYLRTWSSIAALLLSGILFTAIVLIGIRRTIRYIYLLCDEIQTMGSGDLEHPVTVRGRNELGLLAKELDQMRSALFYHRQRERDMIRQNHEMITGLSHDLRTPLTKLLLYTEIIQNDRYEDRQQLHRYLARIREKTVQMKEISDHLLQYSLSQGEPRMHETLDASFRDAFFDRLSETAEELTARGFTVECGTQWPMGRICVIEFCLDRILDNIVSNIEKYAEKAYPVEIRFVQSADFIGFAVKNMRFPRCDRTESSGVGIESVRTMMRQMNGSCTVEQTNTVFEITLLFPNLQSDGRSI